MPTLTKDGRRLNGKGSKWIRPLRRLAIYLRDGFTCQYCGTDLRDREPRDLTLDHLRAQCSGGTHAESNLVTACFSCNSRRGATPWKKYATEGAIQRISRQRRRKLNMALARAVRSGEVPREALWVERAFFTVPKELPDERDTFTSR